MKKNEEIEKQKIAREFVWNEFNRSNGAGIDYNELKKLVRDEGSDIFKYVLEAEKDLQYEWENRQGLRKKVIDRPNKKIINKPEIDRSVLFRTVENRDLDKVKRMITNYIGQEMDIKEELKKDYLEDDDVFGEVKNILIRRETAKDEVKEILNKENSSGECVLDIAINNKDEKMVKYLIENGADISKLNKFKRVKDKKETLENKIERIEASCSVPDFPVDEGYVICSLDVGEYVISKIKPFEKEDIEKLFLNVKNKKTDEIDMLINEKCPPYLDILLKLLGKIQCNDISKIGASEKGKNGKTYEEERESVLKSCFETKDSEGNTLLDIACKNNDLEMVKYLVENGADVKKFMEFATIDRTVDIPKEDNSGKNMNKGKKADI